MRSKPVAIFGGSFDPPHEGHMEVVRELLNSNDFRLVVLALTKQNPLKKLGATEFALRHEMLLKVVSAEKFPITDYPAGSGLYISTFPYNYTYEFVDNWRSKSQDDLVWVIGEDLREEVVKWKNWDKLKLGLKIMPEFHSKRSTKVRQNEISPHPALINFIKEKGLYQ
jgi:nicotinate-nucleotide adenylyltransferase